MKPTLETPLMSSAPSCLRAFKLLVLPAICVVASLAAPAAALADPACVTQHTGSTTVLGDVTRIAADSPYSIDVVCSGGLNLPNKYVVDSSPAHGTLSELSPTSREFTYTPNAGFVGADYFIITPQDTLGPSYFPQVLVTLEVGDHAPVCTGSTGDPVLHGGSVSAPYSCSDADGDPLSIAIVAQPANGSATLSAATPLSGLVAYTSSATSTGVETVTIQALETSDPSVRSNVATITFSVVDTAPTCSAESVTAQTSSPVAFPLTCIDGDGETLTFTRTTAPKHGTIKVDGGNVTYAASAGYLGKDSLAFSATDGIATASIVVNVSVVPDTIRTGTKAATAAFLPTNLTVLNSNVTLTFECPATAKTCTGTVSLVTILKGRKIMLISQKVAMKTGKSGKVKLNATRGLKNAALRPLAGLPIKVIVAYQTKNSLGKKVATAKTIYLHVPQS
jgi:Bacterial Ig domain